MAGACLTYRDWRERVPELVEAAAARWGLMLGEAYPPGAAGHVVRVTLVDGTPAVLKLVFPHREAEHEAEALALWNGDGAVRLLAADDDGWSFVMERCEPGELLARSDPETALDVLVGLLPRLWHGAADPFHTLSDEVAVWLEELPRAWELAERPTDRALLDETMETLRALSSSQGEQVLLHQDLHTDNVLAAEREPWLVIDPKPLRGEREFGVAPIVRDYVLGHSRREVVRRLDRLTSELGLDRDRARWWTIGQTVAWMFESSHLHVHAETVQWLRAA
ncbi:MAG TPA: aminoglycoside phosphotransferase family protein [Gaiellaceae bacterium]|nr:aminoglycoside phosphotransferase family protein [Gaiellaceae bacterium]